MLIATVEPTAAAATARAFRRSTANVRMGSPQADQSGPPKCPVNTTQTSKIDGPQFKLKNGKHLARKAANPFGKQAVCLDRWRRCLGWCRLRRLAAVFSRSRPCGLKGNHHDRPNDQAG